MRRSPGSSVRASWGMLTEFCGNTDLTHSLDLSDSPSRSTVTPFTLSTSMSPLEIVLFSRQRPMGTAASHNQTCTSSRVPQQSILLVANRDAFEATRSAQCAPSPISCFAHSTYFAKSATNNVSCSVATAVTVDPHTQRPLPVSSLDGFAKLATQYVRCWSCPRFRDYFRDYLKVSVLRTRPFA